MCHWKDIDFSVYQLSLPKESLIYPYRDEKNVQNGQHVIGSENGISQS